MKRGRVDVGIAREDYEANERTGASDGTVTSGFFDRAPDSVLATRKIYGAAAPSATKVPTTARHLVALNAAFVKNLNAQWTHNKRGDWRENMREYIAYAREVESKLGARAGNVLTVGSGDCGQLGHGVDEDDDLMVKFPRVVSVLEKKPITHVTCGGLHSAAVTQDGEVYTWGCNDDGALGRTGEENLPAKVDGFGPQSDRRAMLIVGGDSHTGVVTTDGQVFTWGAYKDKEGKLWCDSASPKTSFKQKQLRPFLIKGLNNVVDLRCGSAFNVVRTSNGLVFSWGLGEMGQLGRSVNAEMKDSATGDYDVDMVYQEHLTPARVTLGHDNLPPVKAIGCGSYHTLLTLSVDGALYTCGLNNYGQLGVGSTDNFDVPQLVEDLAHKNVAQVEGGTHHSVVLTTDGEVYTFGRADSGQLGTLDVCQTGDFKDRPQRVTFKSSKSKIVINMIAAGSNHTLALAEGNEVFSWGYGDMLALGTGLEQDENRPHQLQWAKVQFGEADILQIDAGGQHSAIVAARK